MHILNPVLNLDDDLLSAGLNDFPNFIAKIIKQNTKDRLGMKDGRGGARPRKGFVWDNEKRIAFYKAFESLPKINKKNLWNHLYSIFKAGDEQTVLNEAKGRIEFNDV